MGGLHFAHGNISSDISVQLHALIIDRHALYVHLSAVEKHSFFINSQILSLFQVRQLICHQSLVDGSIGRATSDERNVVVIQLPQSFLSHVAGVQDGEFGIHLHGLEFFEGRDERSGAHDVAGNVPHINGESSSLLDNINQANFLRDLTIVIADGSQRKTNAVGQSGAVDEDVGFRTRIAAQVLQVGAKDARKTSSRPNASSMLLMRCVVRLALGKRIRA